MSKLLSVRFNRTCPPICYKSRNSFVQVLCFCSVVLGCLQEDERHTPAWSIKISPMYPLPLRSLSPLTSCWTRNATSHRFLCPYPPDYTHTHTQRVLRVINERLQGRYNLAVPRAAGRGAAEEGNDLPLSVQGQVRVAFRFRRCWRIEWNGGTVANGLKTAVAWIGLPQKHVPCRHEARYDPDSGIARYSTCGIVLHEGLFEQLLTEVSPSYLFELCFLYVNCASFWTFPKDVL